MAQQQAIKLKIAGKSYSFTLKHEANEEQSLAEKEELYRLAEREVNAYVTRFERQKYEGFSTQDCLAMAALQLAISSVSLARSRSRQRRSPQAGSAARRDRRIPEPNRNRKEITGKDTRGTV